MPTNNRKPVLHWVTLAIILVAFCGVAATAKAANPDDPMDWSLDIDVIAREMAEIIAPTLPQRMSDKMVMINVIALGRGLQMKSLLEYDLAFLDEQLALHGGSLGDLKGLMKQYTKNGVCSNGDTQMFIKKGGTITYVYQFVDGVEFMNVKVAECGGAP